MVNICAHFIGHKMNNNHKYANELTNLKLDAIQQAIYCKLIELCQHQTLR